jgi:very-short-patch-repair endonuclease
MGMRTTISRLNCRWTKPPDSMSAIEDKLAMHIRGVNLPRPEREYRFHPDRRWRFDFCWPVKLVAVECEGGTWTKGRHTRPQGFAADCEKYNEAALMGWMVLRFTAEHIQSGEAVAAIERALA